MVSGSETMLYASIWFVSSRCRRSVYVIQAGAAMLRDLQSTLLIGGVR